MQYLQCTDESPAAFDWLSQFFPERQLTSAEAVNAAVARRCYIILKEIHIMVQIGLHQSLSAGFFLHSPDRRQIEKIAVVR